MVGCIPSYLRLYFYSEKNKSRVGKDRKIEIACQVISFCVKEGGNMYVVIVFHIHLFIHFHSEEWHQWQKENIKIENACQV